MRYNIDSNLPNFSIPSSANGVLKVSTSIYHTITTTMFNSTGGIGFDRLGTGRHFATLRSNRVSVLSHGAAVADSHSTNVNLGFPNFVACCSNINFLTGDGLNIGDTGRLSNTAVYVRTNAAARLGISSCFHTGNLGCAPVAFSASSRDTGSLRSNHYSILASSGSRLCTRHDGLTTPGSCIMLPRAVSGRPLNPIIHGNSSR